MDLPLGLATALESGRCVLFLGSGIGYNATMPDGSHLPTGGELGESLAKKYGIDAGADAELAKVAQLVELRKGRKEVIAHLQRLLESAEPATI